MRSTRLRLALLALGLTTFTAGAIAGCGGDDNGGGTGDDGGTGSDTSTGGDDGGTVTDSGGGGGDTGTDAAGPQALASDVSVYLGQIAQLDASGSTPPGATLAWTVKSVPGGSAITTASVLNANAAKPSFTPDVVGDYVLTLTASANGASATKDVTVHAVVAKTFYIDYNVYQPDGAPWPQGPRANYQVVPTQGGDGGVPVSCPVFANGFADPSVIAGILHGADQWEGPAGTALRGVGTLWDKLPDGGSNGQLLAFTSDSSCTDASAPRVLDTVMANKYSGGASDINGAIAPRISPDGNRVLYVHSDAMAGEVGSYVASIGFDGTSPHKVTPFNVYPDGGGQADAAYPYTGKFPPRWAPGGKIALASAVSGSRFIVQLFDDNDNTTPTLALGCNGTIQHFDTLPNGDFIASGSIQLPDGGTTGAVDIFVLHPNSLTKECEIVRDLTTLPSGSQTYGFTVSPDRTRIAYVVTDPTVDAGAGLPKEAIFTAAIDGSTPPTRVPGIPYGAGGSNQYSFRPPRWVAGGTALTFDISNQAADAGGIGYFTSLATAQTAGGGYHLVATADGNGHLIFGLAACNIGHGAGSSLMAFGSMAAFLGLVLRRRRRDS